MLRKGRMPTKKEAEGREWMDESEVMGSIVQLDEVFKQIEPIPAPIVVYRGVGGKSSHRDQSQVYHVRLEGKELLGRIWNGAGYLPRD